MRSTTLSLSAFAASLLLASPGQAATMTFSELEFLSTSYFEDGIVATAGLGQFNGEGDYDDEGTAHLDDGGTPNPAFVTFTMGGPFTAKSFDLIPLGFAFYDCEPGDDDDCEPTSFANVKVTGFNGGAEVASLIFDMSTSFGEILFSDAFTNLTSLVIGFADHPDFGYCDGAPCSHFRIDNVVLDGPPATPAEVPLPAALPLLAAGLGVIAVAGRRRRA
ncbi:PEP-CTERM sorting domain-containing protein [Allitabrizicola rongguiensis]|uniref:PEP-CTERM sorting domain-containing protein n=1 Tax=Alitabrizicola rongguiensis TaxID=2909234 RepID=UPI001F1F74B0|nr:PEP-CTERM sorting domain-containing protein [Tabrizicola rongguiensis]